MTKAKPKTVKRQPHKAEEVKPEPVLFYGHREGPYAAFSNFFPAEFVLDKHRWANSEQAFVYFKSLDAEFQKKIKKTTDPYEVKQLGREAKLRKNWDHIKLDIMIRVLMAKFSQNPKLSQLLLSTGDRPIHENCSDRWWGGGPNYPKGKDLLGKALMAVRAQLRKTQVEAFTPKEQEKAISIDELFNDYRKQLKRRERESKRIERDAQEEIKEIFGQG